MWLGFTEQGLRRLCAPPACRALVFGLGAAIALAGCASAPVSSTGILDERWAWQCDRLVVEWAVETARLQKMTGPQLIVREQDGAGRLRLEVMRCPPQPFAAPDSRALSYAWVLIPVEGGSSPISITGVSPGGWRFMRTVFAGAPAGTLFSGLAYDLIGAEQTFAFEEGNGSASVAIVLEFAAGRLDIAAELAAGPAPQSESTAFLGRGEDFASVYFGDEEFERYAASAAVQRSGAVPLPPLPARPVAVAFDRGLASDRVYWRMPIED